MIGAFADAIRAARTALPENVRDRARLVFTAHSVPIAADAAAGPPAEGGHLYSRQVAEASRLCAEAVGVDDFDLVWQSRSGPPQVPWLDPDICDHLETLAAAGVPAVIVCPVGFVSDHLEVVWDLDTEAREKAAELGIEFVRVGNAGHRSAFRARWCARSSRSAANRHGAGSARTGAAAGRHRGRAALRRRVLRAGAASDGSLTPDPQARFRMETRDVEGYVERVHDTLYHRFEFSFIVPLLTLSREATDRARSSAAASTTARGCSC